MFLFYFYKSDQVRRNLVTLGANIGLQQTLLNIYM